ncbi:MAG: hypothetical protein KAH99_03945 [Verrucomicrobia bacterium]|nr:hypothetical protein [Verrucomicrobiota bacterium]
MWIDLFGREVEPAAAKSQQFYLAELHWSPIYTEENSARANTVIAAGQRAGFDKIWCMCYDESLLSCFHESAFHSRTLPHSIPPMEPITLYITLLLAGFMLIGMELFIPGGILGIIGAVAWLVAAGVGMSKFETPWNMLSAFALLLMGVLTFVVWIKYFPKSRVGKILSLNESSADYKAHSTDDALPVGTAGEAVSTLRPSGIARFDGKRVDVVADGEWIEAGRPVKISSTADGHISVVKA